MYELPLNSTNSAKGSKGLDVGVSLYARTHVAIVEGSIANQYVRILFPGPIPGGGTSVLQAPTPEPYYRTNMR